ncbi:MAG: right-handed parallel beta-helix repeat-containing protein [Myxococcota bacterium]
MSRIRWWHVAVVLVAPALFSGCPAECAEGAIRRGDECVLACNANEDCPRGQHCDNGVCAEGAGAGASSSSSSGSTSSASVSANSVSSSSSTASSVTSSTSTSTSSSASSTSGAASSSSSSASSGGGASTSSSSSASSSSATSSTASSSSGASSSSATSSSSSAASSSSSSGGVLVEVEPIYPEAGANWNQYVANDGSNVLNASGAPCVPDPALRYDQCIHGGELRQVVISSADGCGGFSIQDDLDVFSWGCLDESPGDNVLRFVTLGFKAGRGLRHLLGPDGWLPNAVTISGPVSARSTPTTWWTNPVHPLPDNSSPDATLVLLDEPDAIYVAAESRGTQGYRLTAEGVALVTLDDVTLSHGGTTDPNCITYSVPDRICMVATHTVRFVWVEARLEGLLNGSRAHDGVMLNGTTLSRFRVDVSNLDWDGVILVGSSSNLVEQTRVESTNRDGIWLENASRANTFRKVQSFSNSGDGIALYGGGTSANLFVDVDTINNGAHGFYTYPGADGNTLLRIRSNNNGIDGVTLTSNGNVAQHVVSTHNTSDGLVIAGSDNVVTLLTAGLNDGSSVWVHDGYDNTLHTVALLNDYTLSVNGTGGWNTFHNLASADGPALANLGDTTTYNRFSGVLLGNGDCWVDAGEQPGLVPGSCTLSGTDGSADYPETSHSWALFRPNRSIAGSFVGRVQGEDATNGSDVNGEGAYPSGGPDWTGFDNAYRAWGPDNAGRWTNAAGFIHDWRLKNDDNVIRHTTPNGEPFGESFIPGAPCPIHLRGDVVAANLQDPYVLYLRNAVELLEVGGGNGNGLCESNETCLHAPNFGAYQGEGDLQSCLFDDVQGTAAITNVTMLGYVETP